MKLTNYLRDAFVRAAMDDVPSIDYGEQIRSKVNAKVQRFQKIAKVSEINTSRLNSRYFSINGQSFYGAGLTDEELTTIKQDTTIAELVNLSKVQSNQRSALVVKLNSVIKGCNTRKQAMEALPEFEKYLPTEDPKSVSNLPALANVLTDFVKAGWPKNQKRITI